VKVLYIASEAVGDANLMLTQEITELQRRFFPTSVDPVEFHLLPALKVEDLPGELSRFAPDILHIASHSNQLALSLSDGAGNPIPVSAEMLSTFLPPSHPPRLIYLNSCNSQQIAKELVESGPVAIAIGSTAPISNRAARASAVAFYERLLAGLPVQQAFNTCQRMLEALTKSASSVTLHHVPDVDPTTERLHSVPTLIADFKNAKASPEQDGHFALRLGVSGCPADTMQMIFFTDDESFINDEDTLEDDLSLIVRTTPVNGIIWSPGDFYWRAQGDHRLFAVGVRAVGSCFALGGTLCGAVENRYRASLDDLVPATVSTALKTLRRNNGAELNPVAWDETSRRTNTVRAKPVRKKEKSR
jgi:hypothetical protein